jgi:hypothetical protein
VKQIFDLTPDGWSHRGRADTARDVQVAEYIRATFGTRVLGNTIGAAGVRVAIADESKSSVALHKLVSKALVDIAGMSNRWNDEDREASGIALQEARDSANERAALETARSSAEADRVAHAVERKRDARNTADAILNRVTRT